MSTRWIRIIFLLSLVFALAVLFNISPWLRGPAEWRWFLAPARPVGPLLFSLAAAILVAGGWTWLRHTAGRWRLWLLFGLTLLFQFSLLTLERPNPLTIQFERLASDQASGYFTVARQIKHLPTFLRDYPALMPGFGPDAHPRTKPPGLVLAYYGLERLLARLPALADPIGHWARGIRCDNLWLAGQPNAALAANALMGLLTPLLSALAIWPAYGLTARRWETEAGWLAAGLVALLPGRLIFTPHMDTLYAFLALLVLWLVDTALRRERPLLSLVAGLVLSLASFISLVNILVAPVAGLFLLFSVWQRVGWRRWRELVYSQTLWRHGLALVGGTLSIWLVYWAATGVTPVAINAASAVSRHDLLRSYLLWIPGNLYDFAIFVGLPAFLLGLGALRRQEGRPLALAFWLTLAALLLSGIIRGEVGRTWLMLAPIPAVLAAGSLPRKQRWAIVLLAVTTLTSWAIAVRWEVTALEWEAPTSRPITATLPANIEPLSADFGPDISLSGYEMEASSDELDLTLFWQAHARPDTPYTIFVHVTNAQNEIVAQRDVMPQDGRLPTTCWQASEVIIDPHGLDLTALPPGEYGLRVGLYHQSSGDRPGEPLRLPSLEIR